MSTCEVQFLKNGDMTEVYLPSGRNLNFIDCKVANGRFGPKVNHMLVNSMTRQWNRRDTYGGLLTENIVQAVARDILTDAMLRVDQYFNIVHHVHDEIVVEEPVWDNIGSDPATHFKELMTEVPAWAEGLPIDVDIWSQERYKK
jgi:DNA polymerase